MPAPQRNGPDRGDSALAQRNSNSKGRPSEGQRLLQYSAAAVYSDLAEHAIDLKVRFSANPSAPGVEATIAKLAETLDHPDRILSPDQLLRIQRLVAFAQPYTSRQMFGPVTVYSREFDVDFGSHIETKSLHVSHAIHSREALSHVTLSQVARRYPGQLVLDRSTLESIPKLEENEITGIDSRVLKLKLGDSVRIPFPCWEDRTLRFSDPDKSSHSRALAVATFAEARRSYGERKVEAVVGMFDIRLRGDKTPVITPFCYGEVPKLRVRPINLSRSFHYVDPDPQAGNPRPSYDVAVKHNPLSGELTVVHLRGESFQLVLSRRKNLNEAAPRNG